MPQKTKTADRLAVAIFDFLFILFILLLCFAFLFFARPHDLTGSDTDLLYTVRFSFLRTEHTTGICEGDAVLDAVGKRSIGELVSYTLEPARATAYDMQSGQGRTTVYPGRSVLTLRIRARAKREGDGWSVAGMKLVRGRELALRLPNFAGSGICTETEILFPDS